MARRTAAPARRRGLKTGVRAGRTPQPARDGKVNVFCPRCAAEYRVPHDALDTRVECRHCHRVFSPRATLGARTRPRPGVATVLWTGAGVMALVLLGVFIKDVATREPAARQVAAPRAVNSGWSNPRVQAIRRWVDSVAAGESFGIETGADLGALQRFLEIPAERNYNSAFPEEREKLTARILEVLSTTDKARLFRDFEITHGKLGDETMAQSNTGHAVFFFEPRDPALRGSGSARIDFRMDDHSPLVTGWEVLTAPDIPAATTAEATAADPGEATAASAPGEAPGTHPEIGEPRSTTRRFGDTWITINESELVPLEHLPDTPDELRAEIDGLIVSLLDMDAPGSLANRAIDRLDDIGRPAIPRLLNQLHTLSVDLDGNNLELTRIVRALRVITGRSFDYNPGTHLVQVEDSRSQRLSALKQWYAWWFKYHNRDYAASIDKQESLPPAKAKTIRNQP